MLHRTIHYKICGLDYVYVDAPVKKSSNGDEYLDLPMGVIEKAIARRLIEENVPIRGAEVAFFRKTAGLSLAQWSEKLGMTAAGVLKWEKAVDQRLSKINEVAVRSLAAEIFEIKISGQWSNLIGAKKSPKKISLKIAKAA